MNALFILGLAATQVAGAAISRDVQEVAPLPIGELGWEGSVTPGGPVVQYWGQDIDDIEVKIKKEYPDFSIYTKVSEDEDTQADVSETAAIAARNALESRQTAPGSLRCHERYGQVSTTLVNAGLNHLYGVVGYCIARARSCISTICVNRGQPLNTAIGICNNNNHQITTPCWNVANMAADIRNGCTQPLGRGGQVFSSASDWNVIVAYCDYF